MTIPAALSVVIPYLDFSGVAVLAARYSKRSFEFVQILSLILEVNAGLLVCFFECRTAV